MGAYPSVPYQGDSDLLEASRAGPGESGDPHLRSVTAVNGYHIQATDGPIGHVENMLVDDETWGVHYLIVDTKNWWPGQHVLLSPFAVKTISWLERDVTLDVTCDQVKGSPPWDPATIVSRSYNWPGYGW
jgi:hypothetical protein